MISILISWPTYICGDNRSVISDTSKPESTLKKICDAIAYHAVCESVAIRESLTGHIRSEDNPADMLTKVFIRQKRKHLVSLVSYDMYGEDT